MRIVTASEMYEVDRFTMEEVGLEGKMLMENAGRAIAEGIMKEISKQDEILVLTGPGNNGGDGFVIARTLYLKGYRVRVYSLVPEEKIKGDALYHLNILQNVGVPFHRLQNGELAVRLEGMDVIIDAMLGIGTKGALRSPYAEIVDKANKCEQAMRFAVDIPTGLSSDEGVETEVAFKAHKTFTVQCPKESAFIEANAQYYGELEVVDIGLFTESLVNRPGKKVWLKEDVVRTFPVRERFSHKGSHGRGLIIGGAPNMPGAVMMAARAALRAGAGLVSIAASHHLISTIAPYVPEATYTDLNLKTLDIDSFHAAAVGMGLGRSEQSASLFEDILRLANIPIIIDADGLYHLKKMKNMLKEHTAPVVLTPHFKEAADLLDTTVSALKQNPFSLTRAFSTEYGVYFLLKGPYTIITTTDGDQYVVTTGNESLAKGGSGDVLSGILLGLLLQSHHITEALCNGRFIHGKTAEILTRHTHSRYDLLASDVIEGLPMTLRTICK
ncbi:NAD(P)H-hydrate epimerase [Melghiribacillus thermohalophilus]|uniref:Bifunctional NAD(P)H-hydrate repair enzyme n=1 Tax=Melghiribacillus thermohalophilus TaxID=1324956 RepID=A0A4V6NZX6_9BACI|nr:NAD(P)H-hydrate dehydratase [Melghiribacillus thermohalophilus]TCT20382.1 NAD(P)H-hydrate epimerase [Melghiribacillus thermohalophilus]